MNPRLSRRVIQADYHAAGRGLARDMAEGPTWLTNDPQAATRLRAADDAFAAARQAASKLPLAEKITALREAEKARVAAYDCAWDEREKTS